MRQTDFVLNCLVSASLVALMTPVAAMAADAAADASEGGGLEEIIVTAQKREQSLQNVPASVQAVSGEKIAQTGIAKLGELTAIVPNLQIQPDPIGDRINIRGIQSGNNAGLEQSVSTFVDGVYRGRGVQTRFAFLDIARVEVLRGPQGTLFGKNTIGGALNITTAKPTKELTGEVSAGYVVNGLRQSNFDGFISGPLTDTIRVRLAATKDHTDRGFLFNTFYKQSTPRFDDFGIRGTIEADIGERTKASLRYEHGNFIQKGQPFGIRVGGPLTPILNAFGAPADGRKNVSIGSINPVLDIGSSGNLAGKTNETSLTLTREIGGGTLTAIGAYSQYKFDRQLDADFSPVDVVRFDDSERFKQESLEVRYASDATKPLQFIIGGYLQRNTLRATGDSEFNVRGTGNELAIDTLLNAGCAAANNNPNDRNCILSGLIRSFDGTPLAYTDFGRFLVLDQTDKVAAAFGEATYNITDKLSFTGGLRYSYERKTATQSAIATNFGTRTRNLLIGNEAAYTINGQILDPFRTIGEGSEHFFNLGRTENSLTYSATAQYKPSATALLYAKISSGFKAGGFNSFALSADPAEAEFRPEKATGIEIGSKLKLLNNRVILNIAGFRTKFKDIQTAVFTGSTSFIVQNAAAATSTGVEVDGRFALLDGLTLNASGAYVRFKYDRFPNAACTVDQLFQFRRDTNNPLATIQNCSQAFRNDLKGRTSENTPKFSGTAGLTYVLNLGAYKVTAIGDVIYQSGQFRDSDLDPTLFQKANAKANLTFIAGPESGKWDISVIGKNIFDKKTFAYGSDTPLLEGARQFAPDKPRTIEIRGRMRF